MVSRAEAVIAANFAAFLSALKASILAFVSVSKIGKEKKEGRCQSWY